MRGFDQRVSGMRLFLAIENDIAQSALARRALSRGHGRGTGRMRLFRHHRGLARETYFRTGEQLLEFMLEEARRKFTEPGPLIRREAVERLFDSWERIRHWSTTI